MSFAKPEKKQESEQDQLERLMCSVHGCKKRWSVHSDGYKPMCSEHQWGKKPENHDGYRWDQEF